MEPFSITCHSCAARLKVARPELIDQTLACPKCGSMIHVQHPTGWKPPIPESAGSISALSNVVGGSDFDQIEDLLPKPGETVLHHTAPGSISQKTPASPQPEKPRFQKPIPPANTANDEQPILPGQQWSSPSAQQRKRLILMIGSAIATVFLVAIAIVTIVHFSNTPQTPAGNDQIANGNPATNDAPTPTTTTDNESAPPSNDTPTESSDDPTETTEKFLDDTPIIPQNPIEQTDALGQTPSPEAPASNPPKFAAPVINVDTPKTAAEDLLEQTNNSVDDNSNAPSKVKTLEDLLAEYGISVGELEDIATLQRSYEDFSSSKFSMKPPKTPNSKFERLLKRPIRKLATPEGISLARSARMIHRLSGVTIAIDARQLSLLGLPTNPKLNLALKDATALSAAEKIAELAGAKAAVVGEAILISLPADPKNVAFEMPLPKVGDLNDQQKQRFLDAIQALIAPNAWSRPKTPATIRHEGDTIFLNCSTGIQRHVKLLIDRMNAAAELITDPKNENAAALVATRWSASKHLRTQPTGWAIGPNLSLADFLDRIERLHGLTVMIDWLPVLETGWTPLTQVPGELVESEIGEAIQQLAKAMKLKVIGVDSTTLQLTTSKVSDQSHDLEVYPLMASWAEATPAVEIEQLVFTALGQQAQASFVRVVYEPKCQCLIVVGPQPIQRQVEKLVEQLNRSIDDTEQ